MIPYIQINLPTYDLMVVLGLVAAASFLRLRNSKFNYTKKQLICLFAVAVLGMLTGSRLMYVISKIPLVISGEMSPVQLLGCLINGGFVFYGGLFGALFGIACWCRFEKGKMQKAINFAMPAMVLFHVFGRVGCFLTGCCYGIEAAWGIPLLGVRRFPVQLAEAMLEFCLVVWLLSYEDKVRQKEMQEEPEKPLEYSLADRYLAAYSVLRFCLEFLRGDAERGFWGVLSTSQWVSLIIAVVLLTKQMRKWMRRGKEHE